jgi:hypothetical protein
VNISDKKQKGTAAVEFALVAVAFFTVLFSIIEFGYMYWVNLTMQHAVREGARFAVVANPSSYPVTPSNPATPGVQRCNAIRAAIQDNSMGLYDRLNIQFADLTFSTVDASTGSVVFLGNAADACGVADQIIMIDLKCTLPTITPLMAPFFTNGAYTFHVGATMKNEPL